MRSFFYFVPGRQILTLADAAKIGLAYAFETGIDCTQVPTNGPGGQAGIVCAQQDSYVLGKNGYHASQQVWRQIPGSEVWVGHYRDELPEPADLARAKQLSGWSIELGDGRQWIVPMARSYSEHGSGEEAELRWSVTLPQRLDLAADGLWTRTGISPRYAALWELAEGWLRIRTKTSSPEDKRRFDEQGETDGAVCALQANYRLGRVEAAMLGLFQVDEMVVEVLNRLIDAPTVEAFSKKKLTLMVKKLAATATPGDGINSSAGPAAAIPATVPPVPT